MRKGTRRPRARKELSLARFLEKMLVPVSVSFVSLTCKVLVLTVLILVSAFVSLVSFPAATSVKVSVSAFGSFVLSPTVTSINASSVSFVSTT